MHLFLIAKATHDIHGEVESDESEGEAKSTGNAFFWVIVQIVIIEIVFLLDSIITAIGTCWPGATAGKPPIVALGRSSRRRVDKADAMAFAQPQEEEVR